MGEPNHGRYYCSCVHVNKPKSSSAYQIRPYDNTIKLSCTILHGIDQSCSFTPLHFIQPCFFTTIFYKNKAVAPCSHRVPIDFYYFSIYQKRVHVFYFQKTNKAPASKAFYHRVLYYEVFTISCIIFSSNPFHSVINNQSCKNIILRISFLYFHNC